MKFAGLGLIVSMIASAAPAATLTLYDGSLGTSPQSQGSLFYYSLNGGTETVGPASTTYDSSASASTQGGFSNDTLFGAHVNSAFPSLNAATGFSVDFTLQELAEAHNTNDRAGVSLIVLSSNHTGIELGFWTSQIFAQSGADFTHAESAAYVPTVTTSYSLAVSGSNYSLSANGLPLLTGVTRDYSSFGYPYTMNDNVFLGDDTTSAAGSFAVSRLSVTTAPEPTTLTILAIGGLIVCRRGSRRLA